MDRRSGSSAPFRITPAAKPGAGARDHWEGPPSWGNSHGREWHQLDRSVASRIHRETVVRTFWPDPDSGFTYQPHVGDQIDSIDSMNPDDVYTIDSVQFIRNVSNSLNQTGREYNLTVSITIPGFEEWSMHTYSFLKWNLVGHYRT